MDAFRKCLSRSTEPRSDLQPCWKVASDGQEFPVNGTFGWLHTQFSQFCNDSNALFMGDEMGSHTRRWSHFSAVNVCATVATLKIRLTTGLAEENACVLV